jgi:8-amino-7-oxononanoate synthase
MKYRGRPLIFFGGCDYLRMSQHPLVKRAVVEGLRHDGLTVAASRVTTGNHPRYAELETALRTFFDVPAAVTVGSGYLANLAVAQAFAGTFTHVFMDERAHPALRDAGQALNARVIRFRHRQADHLEKLLARRPATARVALLTDGIFSHDGSSAPLREYLKLLPPDGLLLVDDAHAAAVVGARGRGSAELQEVSDHRLVRTITLSKGFGVYGGAVLGSQALCAAIIERSSAFIGSTPLPLPLVNAALASVKLVRDDHPRRARLQRNSAYVKDQLTAAGFPGLTHAAPIISLPLGATAVGRLKQNLLRAGIYPSWMDYPGGPLGGHFRFVISSGHQRRELDQLIHIVGPFAKESRWVDPLPRQREVRRRCPTAPPGLSPLKN